MTAPTFYVGLHHPHRAAHFPRACISINAVRGRRKPVDCPDILLDSGAFTELERHGRYRHGVEQYAAEVRRLHDEGVLKITAAVAQDYMCEAWMLAKTGLTIPEHQRLTIERYDALLACDLPVTIMPVLQGYAPQEYARHVRDYGGRLKPGMWVGVGSVCKRNADPMSVEEVLLAIHAERSDLRLHLFGLKITALRSKLVQDLTATADSMAWSYAARKSGRDANDWREAKAFADQIAAIRPRFYPRQMEMTL